MSARQVSYAAFASNAGINCQIGTYVCTYVDGGFMLQEKEVLRKEP